MFAGGGGGWSQATVTGAYRFHVCAKASIVFLYWFLLDRVVCTMVQYLILVKKKILMQEIIPKKADDEQNVQIKSAEEVCLFFFVIDMLF